MYNFFGPSCIVENDNDCDFVDFYIFFDARPSCYCLLDYSFCTT